MTEPRSNAIHDWFGLTYASHLVVPRMIMQEMPAVWQEKMVALLNEMNNYHRAVPSDLWCFKVFLQGKRGRTAASPWVNYRYDSVAKVIERFNLGKI